MRARFPPLRPTARVNVTPMIDVFMCLIVFFLIVGRLAASERSGTVDLPSARAGEYERTTHRLVVNVEAGAVEGAPARIVIEGTSVDLSELVGVVRERLAEEAETAVFVRADRNLPYGEVWPVIRTCAAGGATRIRLAAEAVR